RGDGRVAARTQGAFVAGGYGRDRGRRSGPSSAARRHKRHFESGSNDSATLALLLGLARDDLAVARRALEGSESRLALALALAVARPPAARGRDRPRGADDPAEDERAQALAPVVAVHGTILS